jgi:ectoine hydroxylase-related dioxygenase (phytanoyl-CoA dioxygenase family)
MLIVDCRQDAAWLSLAVEALRYDGCCIVVGVIDEPLLRRLRAAMYRVRDGIAAELGSERLARAGELGVLRLMMKWDEAFFSLLELPPVLAVVDAVVSPTATLHLQNGFILPSFEAAGETPKLFQYTFHRDFPRYLNGYVASVNTLFAIDPFTRQNGATWVVPGTHQHAEPPGEHYMSVNAVPAECPPGSMVVFDSTLWHAAGQSVSGSDRLAINQQYTRSWIKQQMDYVRALGHCAVVAQPERTQQLLGYFTRVVTSLDEYYRPEAERLYRKAQG